MASQLCWQGERSLIIAVTAIATMSIQSVLSQIADGAKGFESPFIARGLN